jgi:hypothetical protein
MTPQLILVRAVVALITGTSLILLAALLVSDLINRGNDMTDDEDFADMCARTETS